MRTTLEETSRSAVTKKDRNLRIGEMYTSGSTQSEIAAKFKLTTARVGQILRIVGILQSKEGDVRRTAFTGIHMDEDVKEAMKNVAESDGKSMSRFMSDLAEEEVKRRGIVIERLE